MDSSCIRESLVWILGKFSPLKVLSSTGAGFREVGRSSSPEVFKRCVIWCLGTQFSSGRGSAGLRAALGALRGLFQPSGFCDSVAPGLAGMPALLSSLDGALRPAVARLPQSRRATQPPCTASGRREHTGAGKGRTLWIMAGGEARAALPRAGCHLSSCCCDILRPRNPVPQAAADRDCLPRLPIPLLSPSACISEAAPSARHHPTFAAPRQAAFPPLSLLSMQQQPIPALQI